MVASKANVLFKAVTKSASIFNILKANSETFKFLKNMKSIFKIFRFDADGLLKFGEGVGALVNLGKWPHY